MENEDILEGDQWRDEKHSDVCLRLEPEDEPTYEAFV